MQFDTSERMQFYRDRVIHDIRRSNRLYDSIPWNTLVPNATIINLPRSYIFRVKARPRVIDNMTVAGVSVSTIENGLETALIDQDNDLVYVFRLGYGDVRRLSSEAELCDEIQRIITFCNTGVCPDLQPIADSDNETDDESDYPVQHGWPTPTNWWQSD